MREQLKPIETLIRSLATWATVRYAISGTIVAVFYLGMPILINAELGIPLEACLPVVYVIAVMLQFTLQRLFVFRHVSEFALSIRRQVLWYVVIAAIQYPLSALATAFLPSLLGVPERAVYVVATLTIAFLTFLFLRGNVFHSHDDPAMTDAAAETQPASAPSAAVR
jgi:putative flippase GtrA